jgi:hypothetical protein
MKERPIQELCLRAIRTKKYRIRLRIIEYLRIYANEAGNCLINHAKRADNPDERKWALFCLSMLGFRNAREVIWESLMDINRSVRAMAALNAHLYDDAELSDTIDRMIKSKLI